MRTSGGFRTWLGRAAAGWALVALAGVAAAAPVTTAFEPVVDEMFLRDASLADPPPREQRAARKSLDRGFLLLSREADDLGDDLRLARRLETTLAKGFPGDGTFDLLFEDLADALDGATAAAHAEVTTAVLLLADGTPRTKATARLATAEDILEDAAGAARPARWALLLRAWKQVDRADRIASKGEVVVPPQGGFVSATLDGQPWQTNALFGAPVTGSVTVREAGGLRGLVIRGRRYLALPDQQPGPVYGGQQILEIRITGVAADIEPGTYPVGTTGGVSVSAVFIHEDDEGAATTWLAISGSVTLTSVDVGLGSGGATGTFGFTVHDGAGGSTRLLSAGSFAAENLPRTPNP